MGVPTLFLSLIRNKNFRNLYAPIVPGNTRCDFLMLDFNGIVYTAYEKVKKDIEGKHYTKRRKEDDLIREVIRYCHHLICEVVQPQKMTYIAIDGPAPRAKMVQQRGRRYKGYQEKMFIKELKRKHHIEEGEETWDGSANIAPGTEFMDRLSESLLSEIRSKNFSRHQSKMEVIYSSSNVPGEGEHKIMPIIKNMVKSTKNKDDSVFIYSKDADLIVLSTMTHKNNIHIVRTVQGENDNTLKQELEGHEYFTFNIDSLREGWFQELSRENIFEEGTDPMRVLNDYNFLTFFVGNDFVQSLPFLKVKKDGLKIMRTIYNQVKHNHTHYLIDYDSNDSTSEPRINNAFLRDIFIELAKREDKLMKEDYRQIERLRRGYLPDRTIQKEEGLTPFEVEKTRYEHLEVCSPHHPLHSEYHMEFDRINYNQPIQVWRDEFYQYYMGISKDDMEEFNRMRVEMVINYFESLVFNLRYYTKGVPSWRWHPRFRFSPLPSDMVYVIQNVLPDLNSITFEMSRPYTPFQQLMMILPPQNAFLLPEVLRPIMTDVDYGCVQYYPEDFRLDVYAGGKTIYSEPILPEIEDEHMIPIIQEQEQLLNDTDKARNRIEVRPLRFV